MKNGIVAAECSIMSRSRLLLRVCVGHTTSLTISISSKYHFPPHLVFIIDKGTLNGHFFSCTSLPPLLSAFLLKDTSTPIEIWWRHPDEFYSALVAYNSPTPLSLISSLLSSAFVCISVAHQSGQMGSWLASWAAWCSSGTFLSSVARWPLTFISADWQGAICLCSNAHFLQCRHISEAF